jgi:hypothetical protein
VLIGKNIFENLKFWKDFLLVVTNYLTPCKVIASLVEGINLFIGHHCFYLVFLNMTTRWMTLVSFQDKILEFCMMKKKF